LSVLTDKLESFDLNILTPILGLQFSTFKKIIFQGMVTKTIE